MKVLVQEQFLPISIDKAWSFFATPHNLNAITPDDMLFEIRSEIPAVMYEGLLIHYRIRPFLNIPFNWVTEISHISDKKYFVDEQRFGPYRLWHHEHHFKAVEGGVLMTDILHYDIGKWIFGSIAGWLFVHKRVAEIFSYRKIKLEEMFGK